MIILYVARIAENAFVGDRFEVVLMFCSLRNEQFMEENKTLLSNEIT